MATNPPGAPGPGSPPPGPQTNGSVPPPAAETKKPIGWIVATAVVAVIAIGFAIWGITTNSDLDSANAKLDKQRAAIAAAAKDVKSTQKAAAYIEAKQLAEYKRTRHVLRKNQKTVAQQRANIAKQKSDVRNAQQQLDDAGTREAKLQAQLNLTQQKLDVANACESGTISAIDSVFTAPNSKAGINRLNSALADLSKDCGQSVG